MSPKTKTQNVDIFRAFLNCPTKGYYKILGIGNDSADIIDCQQHIVEDYKQKCLNYLCSSLGNDEYLFNASIPQDLEKKECRLFLNCMVITEKTKMGIEAVERNLSDRENRYYIPFRFVPTEKIKKQDKLMLAFDAFALSHVSGKLPPYGKIMHGSKFKIAKIKLDKLFEETRLLFNELARMENCNNPPQLVLNKHCAECEFRVQCRRIALEKDELTLLSGMTPKERKKYHDRGIFTITQLSYTFRPRKK
jgi:predicted RecB family nuclease